MTKDLLKSQNFIQNEINNSILTPKHINLLLELAQMNSSELEAEVEFYKVANIYSKYLMSISADFTIADSLLFDYFSTKQSNLTSASRNTNFVKK